MGDRLETRDRRETETGGRRRQVGDGDSQETGGRMEIDGRLTGDKIQETGFRTQKTGDGRQVREGDKRPETRGMGKTGDRRRETGCLKIELFKNKKS